MPAIQKPLSSLLYNRRLNYTAYIYQLCPSLQTIYRPFPGQKAHSFALSLLPQIGGGNHGRIHPASVFSWTHSDQPDNLYLDSADQEEFIQLMHSTISKAPEDLEYLLGSRAKRQQSGWLSLVDERAPMLYGRTPEPDDTIGMIQCQEGVVLPKTYDPMPPYRLVSPLGIFSLPKPLYARLMVRLNELRSQ